MSIQIADVVASVIVSTVGSGLVGNYLLQGDRAQQETKLARLRTELDGEIRRLQTSLNRTFLVHRVQFETEFAAMKMIWEKAMAARGIMAGLRPMSGTAPVGETPEQRKERLIERLQRFSSALGELKDAIFNNSPFIPEVLYDELFEHLLLAAQAEQLSVSVHRRDEPDWYETGERNLINFNNSVDRTSRLIRDRVNSLGRTS